VNAHNAQPAARLAVLISGGGRTLANLHDRILGGTLPAMIELVIASRECPGAALARARRLRTLVIEGRIPAERLGALLRQARADWVVLAGYLCYLEIPPDYRGRIVNIHPALLPAFGGKGMYGRRVHEAVLLSGAAESGCTVHFVDEEYDHGPIILQKRCPVLPTDTPDTLAARVFELEKQALPEALTQLIVGEGRHTLRESTPPS
jgi:phosphoribosylglycinamide formyltransferase-1